VGYAAEVRAIVLPVRSLDGSKTRLAPVLTAIERAALTLAMLEDVLDATLAMPGWETWVVSPDGAVLEVAAVRGARPLTDTAGALGPALAYAEDEGAAAGLGSLAVLLPDTPLITPAALTRALHTLGPVVIAPSADGIGTNLLLRRPPSVMPSSFGRDSFRRHVEAAAERDLPIAVVETGEIGFDLDVPGDILTMLRNGRRGRTRQVLEEMEAAPRVAAV
jgi:2-phospho-L-lactate guanylyltransferase